MRAALRRPASRDGRQPAAQMQTFPAPVAGWVTNASIASERPGAARVMENFVPLESGVRLRKGAFRVASVDGVVTSLFGYTAGAVEDMFAATASALWNVTAPADPDTPDTPILAGMASGYFSAQQIRTSGGAFTLVVNGTDDLLLYDGAEFYRVNTATQHDVVVSGATGAFTVAATLTGGTSAQTATIAKVTTLAAGVLRLHVTSPSGAFTINEALTASSGGSGTMVGNLKSSPVNITGISSATFTHVSLYASRLFFAAGSSVWYLPVDSIGGAAAEFPLGAVFQRGGRVLFTTSWSASDAGEGMDDRFVAVSTLGEVVVYIGTNPSSASTWAKQGLYEIPRPLGKNAFQKIAGDVLIATEEGLVSLAQATANDRAALSLSAVSRPIERDWRLEATRRSGPWEIAKWNEGNLGLVSTPTDTPDSSVGAQCFMVNLETGAWALVTGWDARCLAVIGGGAYFGTNDGRILQAERGGSDDGAIYTGRISWHPSSLGSPGNHKTAEMARASFVKTTPFIPKVSVAVDYGSAFPPAPSFEAISGVSVWGTGMWGSATWGAAQPASTVTQWISIGRDGFAFAPQVQISSGGDVEPGVELVAFDLLWKLGAPVV